MSYVASTYSLFWSYQLWHFRGKQLSHNYLAANVMLLRPQTHKAVAGGRDNHQKSVENRERSKVCLGHIAIIPAIGAEAGGSAQGWTSHSEIQPALGYQKWRGEGRKGEKRRGVEERGRERKERNKRTVFPAHGTASTTLSVLWRLHILGARRSA